MTTESRTKRFLVAGMFGLLVLSGCARPLVPEHQQLGAALPQDHFIHRPADEVFAALREDVTNTVPCRVVACDETLHVISWAVDVENEEGDSGGPAERFVIATVWVRPVGDHSAVRLRRLIFREGRIAPGGPQFWIRETGVVNALRRKLLSTASGEKAEGRSVSEGGATVAKRAGEL